MPSSKSCFSKIRAKLMQHSAAPRSPLAATRLQSPELERVVAQLSTYNPQKNRKYRSEPGFLMRSIRALLGGIIPLSLSGIHGSIL
jgi:hypothetical protein